MEEMIHIYHTNDLHSHLEHWPSIHKLVTERRRWHEEEGDEVFVFDIGDHMDRWHPLSDATRGKANCRLLNEAGYDAGTIGNNEGITLPFEDLDSMYLEKEFEMLVANLFNQDGSRPVWAKPYHVYISKKGTRIGVIGVTVNFGRFYEQLGWKVTDPVEEIENCVDELKKQSDVIILLSHLGIHDDERIAEQFPEIDVILGGHTHHILHEGKEVGSSLLAGAGKFGYYTGHVTVKLDVDSKRILQKTALLYDMNEAGQAEDEKEMAAAYYMEGRELMGEPVANLPAKLTADPMQHTELARLLVQALREWCDADCAFMNAGMILKGLKQGDVTRFDLLEICPHPINPCTINMSGAELKEVLLQTRDESWPHLQIKGLGFRGTVMGVMEYDGIEFRQKGNVQQVFINGELIDAKKQYLLAIPDMFTFGRFFPEIQRAEEKRYWLPEFLRNLLEWKLTNMTINI
ncbi:MULTISPECIES: bifunctional UDP-sugar hydrolase/5'-nucleotidase [Bacillaceae]|uniref:bifunctional metallophosphatase/5'-nucleotidase n=1 Tax=Bacillaceae TaxID=186817 RepID=UPI00119FE3B7|nr:MULTISPECIES: bifunctional UDP-sugar hydrolase/5'-nucleotidase [Bacillaceae]MCM3123949.1 bifunctional metallophosphatase/5'-nucleotidase [Mesobacillus sp. MER 33]MCM3233798.1 bifunctional metallophosphatase/5'-nucleotidase [Mesobacillus sp. MER 48]